MSSLRLLINFTSNRILFRLFSKYSRPSIMSENYWDVAKESYMSMPIDQKRAEYTCGKNFLTTDDIKTWYEYSIENKHELGQKIPMLPEHTINPELNKELVHKVSMIRGDITTLEVDAIVNAANKSLLGGGGVDGAIHRAAGPYLLEENKTLGGCATGEAKITGGYRLPARYVIATVGPHGEKPQFLQQCYSNCLKLMLHKKLRTIAFPCISTGIYGYPLKPAAQIAAMEVRKCLEQNWATIDRVIFCLFSESDENIYRGIMQSYFPLSN